MSCVPEENLLAFRDGELPPRAAEAVRAHLAGCPRCAASLREVEQSFAALGSALATILPETVPTARLRARLASTREETGSPPFSWAQFFWRFGALATVVAVASLGGWLLWESRSVPLPQPGVQVRILSSPPIPHSTPQPPGQPTPQPVHQEIRQAARRPPHRVSSTPDAPPEVVTQFFALREGDDLMAMENARLIRVELTGSALREFGWPADPVSLDGPIKADVMLGDDGLARAIRFIH